MSITTPLPHCSPTAGPPFPTQEAIVSKTGKKPIVIRRMHIQQAEHDDKDAAIAEASRLATKEQDAFVVYVPVAIVRPKAEVTVETL